MKRKGGYEGREDGHEGRTDMKEGRKGRYEGRKQGYEEMKDMKEYPSFSLSVFPSVLPSFRPPIHLSTSHPSVPSRQTLPPFRPFRSSSRPSVHPPFLPSFLPSVIPSLLPSFLPSFRPSYLHEGVQSNGLFSIGENLEFLF